MNYFNIYGLLIIIIIMIPNIIFAIKFKNMEDKYHNKLIEITEQIGRFGSITFMIFHVPILEYGYWFNSGKTVYIIVTGFLTLLYCLTWILYFQNQSKAKAMALAIIPTVLFLFSGIMLLHILLIITSVLFGVGHIIITYNNN